MIEFDNVTRSYGHKVAVDGLSLMVPPGELFALLGPNGAGKTTTIKMLVGLLRPDAGDVRVCGHDVVGTAAPGRAVHRLRARRAVPLRQALGPRVPGIRRRDAGARPRDHRRAHRPRDRATSNLAEFLDDLTETYSHGMKQRLVFASALLHDPAVLVVDEPMVGLDPRSVRLVKDLLRTQAAAGTTVFMSTHTLAVAEEIADRIGIIDRGRLHFLGTVGELQQELSSPHASLEHFFLELTDGGERPRQSPQRRRRRITREAA